MRKVLPLACILLFLLVSCSSPDGVLIAPASTIEVDKDDTQDSIILKAAHVVPTANQLHALENEFIAFIHFGPNTFTRMEWGTGMEDPAIFNLQTLDTDQWCAAMQAAGMKRVIFTAKHHDGFCLWQTRYTTHGIKSSPYKKGQGDVLRELSVSCRKYGLELGIYLSPADLYQIESPEGLYGNLSQPRERTIPEPVAGRPFEHTRKFKFTVDDYNAYFLNQLYELLTEYGPIHEVWLDGAHPKRKGNQQYDYLAWKTLIRELAPEAVIFGREDVRWCGNESGRTRDTEWNVIPYQENPHQMNRFGDLTAADLGSRERLWEGKYLHYQMAETNTSIREGWFYRDDTNQRVRSADDVYDMYERSVGGNSIFLLNIPPNRKGRFSSEDEKVLREVGQRIKETYGTNLLAGAEGPVEVLDERASTYTILEKGEAIEINTTEPITINRFLIQEAVMSHSERVEGHALYARLNDQWQEIAAATNIGYKRILRFPEVTARHFRLVVTGARLPAAIAKISAHFYTTRPPQLQIKRDSTGWVVILPKPHPFDWKPHGEDIAGNLNRKLNIRYTTEGSEPDSAARVYEGPFSFKGGTIKARVFTPNDAGSTATELLGIRKDNWILSGSSGETEGHPGAAAFDGAPATYWSSRKGAKSPFLTIDLGAVQVLNGFAYTPPTGQPAGLMESGEVEVSKNGKDWSSAGDFSFGNLVNDPTKRVQFFDQPVNTRYIKLKVKRVTGGADRVVIAEIDVLTP